MYSAQARKSRKRLAALLKSKYDVFAQMYKIKNVIIITITCPNRPSMIL